MTIKLFLFGGCDLADIANEEILKNNYTIVDYKHNFGNVEYGSLEWSKMRFPEQGTTTISMFTEPGPIALRLTEQLYKLGKKRISENTFIYHEIAKFPYFEFYKKYAGTNDYLLMSLGPELFTRMKCGREYFTILPNMYKLSNQFDPLHWLFKDYICKEKYHITFDDEPSLYEGFIFSKSFLKNLEEIFQNRIILVKPHISNLIIKDGQISKINTSLKNVLFYKSNKIVRDGSDWSYAEKLWGTIITAFQRKYSYELPIVELDKDESIFLDANHRWGVSPFHLDKPTRIKIAKEITAKLSYKQNRNIVWNL